MPSFEVCARRAGDLEQSAEAQHKSRHAADQGLRDCDQNEDPKTAIRQFAHCHCSVALSVHEFGKIVCPLSVIGLEGKVDFPRNCESVT